MKISPLAVWCRNLSSEDTFKAVWEEVGLTHPNETVRTACAFYVIAIGWLLKGDNREAAYNKAKDFINTKANQEIREWLREIERETCDLPVHKPAGWVKIAFVYGMRYMLQGMGYVQAISEIMLQGGDTDTNACIIGALIGAAEGLEGIPGEMIEKVRSWEPARGGIRRPKFLQVKENFHLIDRLIGISPDTLSIIG